MDSFLLTLMLNVVAGSAFQAQHKYRLDQLVVAASLAIRVHHRHQSFETLVAAPDMLCMGVLMRPVFSRGHPQCPVTSSVASRFNAVPRDLSYWFPLEQPCFGQQTRRWLKYSLPPHSMCWHSFQHGRRLHYQPQAANMPRLVTSILSSPITICR